MATIREWLENNGFDFETGTIVYQPTTGSSPGCSYDEEIQQGVIVGKAHVILDREFNNGYGSPQCPRFFARDNDAVYFPVQYDGMTYCERVPIDTAVYVNGNQPTPYPGG